MSTTTTPTTKAKRSSKAKVAKATRPLARKAAKKKQTAELKPPYVGLRYFSPAQSRLFAARKDDVENCAREFNEARILILHGTTGCGKSSFLRAGLKPYIETMNGGKMFEEENEGELPVIRSGDDPLERIARKVFDDIEKCEAHYRGKNGREELLPWGNIKGRVREAKLEATDWPSFKEKTTGHNAARLAEALRRLAGAVDVCPVIVIDQAEEIFTGETASAPDEELTPEKRALRRARTDEYFIFLRAFSKSETRARLIISLRTEYKGQFDDRLRASSAFDVAQHTIRGFHLPDLETEKIIEAIKRPAELSEYNLSFEEGVPRKIAEALETIPVGGRLPVMQVACLRLWQKERDRLEWAERNLPIGEGSEIKITSEAVDELGAMDTQIDQFLRESFARMYSWFKENGGVSEIPDYVAQFDDWMRLLRHRLVDIQADGRATTRRIKSTDLVRDAERAIDSGVRAVDEVKSPEDIDPDKVSELDWLALDRVGILRKDVQDNPDKKGRQAAWWMLGHDSVGLALERWRLVFGADSMNMMKMGMRQRRREETIYFPGKKPKESWKLAVPEELLWDRYLLQLAMNPDNARVRPQHDLGSRLGIHLIPDPNLRALNDTERSGMSWQKLLGAMEKHRRAGNYVLFLCERNNIAGFQKSLGVSPSDWKDIAIADVFYGNALIGPQIFADDDRADENVTRKEEERQKMLSARITRVLDYLIKEDVEILCFDQSAKTMVQLALEICGKKPDEIADSKFKFESDIDLPVDARDFMFSKMQAANRANAKTNRKTFIVGSDYGRAAAQQTRQEVHFSLLDLKWLSTWQAGAKKYQLKRMQEAVTHTVWNLGYPPGVDPDNQALELRVASLAYHLSNRVRSQPDDLVRLVHMKHEDLEVRRGFTLSREVVRDTIQQCFNFHHFEDYGNQFYRGDSEQRYWVETDNRFSATTSRKNYFKLLSLRGEANKLFDEYEKLARQSEPTPEAKTLNECAWNNYQIFNFYDARNQIRDAVEAMQTQTQK